jgi:hypothetical protein
MTPITVTRDGDQVRITVGDQVVATGPDVPTLVDAAHALGESDPLKLRAGARLVLDLSAAEKGAVLDQVREHNTLTDELRERDEELAYPFQEKPPLETGTSVDGQPWGWLHVFRDAPTYGPNENSWRLIPTWDADPVLKVYAECNAGMTGGPLSEIGIRRWESLAAVFWSDVFEGGPRDLWVEYQIEDWNRVLLDATAWLFDGNYGPDGPLCPACVPNDYFDIRLWVDPIFSDELIGQAVANLYRPCAEDTNSPDALFVRDLAGHDWRWIGESWMPCSVEAGEGPEGNPRSSSGGTCQP